MIICRRCGELSKWQADKVCEACKDTREWPIDMMPGVLDLFNEPDRKKALARLALQTFRRKIIDTETY